MRLSPTGLRSRLVLLILLTVLPLAGLALYDALEGRRLAVLRAEGELMRHARRVAGDYTSLVEGARQVLTILAEHPAVAAHDAEA